MKWGGKVGTMALWIHLTILNLDINYPKKLPVQIVMKLSNNVFAGLWIFLRPSPHPSNFHEEYETGCEVRMDIFWDPFASSTGLSIPEAPSLSNGYVFPHMPKFILVFGYILSLCLKMYISHVIQICRFLSASKFSISWNLCWLYSWFSPTMSSRDWTHIVRLAGKYLHQGS